MNLSTERIKTLQEQLQTAYNKLENNPTEATLNQINTLSQLIQAEVALENHILLNQIDSGLLYIENKIEGVEGGVTM